MMYIIKVLFNCKNVLNKFKHATAFLQSLINVLVASFAASFASSASVFFFFFFFVFLFFFPPLPLFLESVAYQHRRPKGTSDYTS